MSRLYTCVPDGPEDVSERLGYASETTVHDQSMPNPTCRAFILLYDSASMMVGSVEGASQWRAESTSRPRKGKRGASITFMPDTLYTPDMRSQSVSWENVSSPWRAPKTVGPTQSRTRWLDDALATNVSV